MNDPNEVRELKKCLRILERLAREEGLCCDELREKNGLLKQQIRLLYQLIRKNDILLAERQWAVETQAKTIMLLRRQRTRDRFRAAMREPVLIPSPN